MRFFRSTEGSPSTVAVLSGAFHPVTNAHLALASSALERGAAGEVVLLLPETFPHKEYGGVSLEMRLEMLRRSVAGRNGLSIAISKGGLFLEIARECQAAFQERLGRRVRLRFLCGRDTAERIVGWEYGELPPIEEQLREYELLVAPRQGVYTPPPHLSHAVLPLEVDGFNEVSSTEVRERLASGEPWEHLVPDEIHPLVEKWYRVKNDIKDDARSARG